MASRFADLFHREPKPRREATPHFSHLQKAILCWLYRETQRRQRSHETESISFPALVEGLNAEKTEVVTNLRRLMKKAFVDVFLPRGEWTRYVRLTAPGEKHAKTLAKDTKAYATYLRGADRDKRDSTSGYEGTRRRRASAASDQDDF